MLHLMGFLSSSLNSLLLPALAHPPPAPSFPRVNPTANSNSTPLFPTRLSASPTDPPPPAFLDDDNATEPLLPPTQPARLTGTAAIRHALTHAGGADLVQEDILKMFLIERQLHGDLLSKISDQIWKGEELKVLNVANAAYDSPQVSQKVEEDENSSGFLKLIQTQLWISGGTAAPSNRKLASKEWQNDSEKRKTINLLKYTALKRELLLLTTGIGAACTGYCLLTFSIEAAISYATGVLFSCLYLQLLYYHTDNLWAESIPQVFLKKKVKKIGIRSDDLQYAFEKTVKGSGLALSSPRLIIPAAVYGLWWILHNNFSSFFDFQLLPALLGVFAYKAAALVQVYRDNENLRMIFPEDEGPSS